MFDFFVDGQQYIFDQDKMILSKKDEYNCDTDTSNVDFELKRKKYFANANLIMNNCCNLACDYCYADKGKYDVSGLVIDFETAKKVIDTLIELASVNGGEHIHITFFGGEPLLQFKLIKQIVKYTNDTIGTKRIRPNWDIVINGTLFTDEIIEFLEDNKFGVTISIDGDKQVHDAARHFCDGKGSYDIIKENISKWKNKNNLVARVTINDSNTDVVCAVNSIRELGIYRIVIGADNNMSAKNYDVFEDNLRRLFEEYTKAIKAHDYYIIDNISRYIVKLALRKKTSYHCSAGISYFSISADKKVYLCHRFVGQEAGYMGQVSGNLGKDISEVSNKNLQLFKSQTGRPSMCKDCQLFNICGGTCKYDAYNATGNILGDAHRACRLKKLFIISSFKLLISLSEKERKDYLMYYMKNMTDY